MRVGERIIGRMLIRGLILWVILSIFTFVFGGFGKSTLGVVLGSLIAYLDFVSLVVFVKALSIDGSKFAFFILQILKYVFIVLITAFLLIKGLVNPLYFVVGLTFLPLIPFLDFLNLNKMGD
ncbi:MAG: hypothetical protein ACPLSJ_02305 [Thermosulfidibacteraceae bacterium]